MVAINFQKRFADVIESGEKTQTVRSKARCSPGDKLQLYTGQRKLLDAVCIAVKPITIDGVSITLDGRKLCAGWSEKNDYLVDYDCDFAKADGFEDFQAMADWFEYAGLPFTGYLIKWRKDD